jgi:hypothetical protein
MNTVFGEIAQLAERLAHKKEPMVAPWRMWSVARGSTPFETRKLMVRVHLSLSSSVGTPASIRCSKICLN